MGYTTEHLSGGKRCPYKILGGGIRPPPLVDADNEDPRTDNAHRAKMQIEPVTPRRLDLGGEITRGTTWRADTSTPQESIPNTRLHPAHAGRVMDVARSSTWQVSPSGVADATPEPMSPTQPSTGTLGGVLGVAVSIYLSGGDKCKAPPRSPGYQSPLGMGQDSHRDSTIPVSSIGAWIYPHGLIKARIRTFRLETRRPPPAD